MESNGSGSWQQKITVHVDASHSEEVAKMLGASGPFNKQGKPDRAYIEWTRSTTKRGDDEDVVFGLCMLLGTSQFDWNIDWEASDY